MGERKVALITDTHFGVRKGSQVFHDYFEKFYNEVFFPALDEHGIDTVIHLGDTFDVRKGIDYWSLQWAKRVFFDPLKERGIKVYIIVGNHDIFYKTSLRLNSGMNLTEYDNVTIIDAPQTLTIKGEKVFFVPWLCEGSAELFMEERNDTKAKLAMGHLELAGFYANQNYQCQHGTDPGQFSRFEMVFSGHFHKRDTRGNITYLGNPYQLYWNDEGETRGFGIFDLDTHEVELVDNPFTMFNKVYYNEDKKKLFNPNKFKDSYVKIIVEKSSPDRLSKFVDKLYEVGIHDLKIIENMDVQVDDDVNIEAEDTLTTLTNYVSVMETPLDKENLVNIFKSLYVEAQEV